MIDKKKIMDELLKNQRKNIQHKKKLNYSDMYRITKYVNKSLFGNECCLWSGYVCCFNKTKINYINFFFGGKKIQINRLLYENYIGDVKSDEIIKNICESGGKCCNVYHYGKFGVNNHEESENSEEIPQEKNKNNEEFNEEFIEQFKIIF
jgi:hypothetical protein